MPRGMAQISCEIADNPSAYQRGLMFRKDLPEDSGMLFDFKKSQGLSFWGMNTFIPLDIAFITDEGIIDSIGIIKPHRLESVKSTKPCKYAVEVPEGTFSRHGISSGDFAEILRNGSTASVILIKKIPHGSIKVAASDMDVGGKFNIESETEPAKDSLKRITTAPAVPSFSGVFDALKWCIANSQVCRISYRTESGRVVNRDVEPHDIFYSSNKRHQILSAWDENAVSPRSYIVMRIISYAIPGRKFTPKIQLY
jgi:uncharacterized membrane protein (UPF0127 family)